MAVQMRRRREQVIIGLAAAVEIRHLAAAVVQGQIMPEARVQQIQALAAVAAELY
jgi:putative Ca2+/H+ antiporter (TMEM165/GDT1 family)